MESNAKYKKTFKSKFIERVSDKSKTFLSKRLFNEHKIRYLFAKKFVKNKIVVDVACGNGYGSKILKEAGAKYVFGIDKNKKAVEYARKNYMAANVNFSVGDGEKMSIDSKSIDVVISFETIEHLKNPIFFLKEIKRVLKLNGILVLSTPNREFSYEDNPFHLKEYTLNELNLILSDFSKKEFYGQRRVFKKITKLYKYLYKKTPNTFLRFRPWENQKITRLKNISDTSFVYFLAVCRNQKLES